jgi:hypothetical protein
MRQFGDPAELSPDQRLRELAGIFAVGVMRLRRRRRQTGELGASPRNIVDEPAASRLEVSGETVLSVQSG